MKMKILLLFASLASITGCNIIRIDNKEIDEIIDTILVEGNTTESINYRGYSYYLPVGLDKRNNNEYNEIIYSKHNVYYFYVDIVSYYNKVDYIYTINEDAYFSNKIERDDKYGYIEINKTDDNNYFVEIMYNYSKIEVITTFEDMRESISYSTLVLNSIDYNDIIIDALIGEKALLLDAEVFNIFKPKREEEGNFLDYIEEYDKYEEPEEDDSVITNEYDLQIIE